MRLLRFLVALTLLATPARAETLLWSPLEDALTAAQSSGSLVILYLRIGSADGAADRRSDLWIADSAKHEATLHSYQQMALARMDPDLPLLAKYNLSSYFRTNRPYVLLLDPSGGLVFEFKSAFADFDRFAAKITAFRQVTPIFLSAMRWRQRGDVPQALLMSGTGLIEAGEGELGDSALRQALTMARESGREEIAQRVQISLAAAAIRSGRNWRTALDSLRQVATHASNPEIAAVAWLVLGNADRASKNLAAATRDYQEAYRIAPKPSDIADRVRSNLEMLGAMPPEESAKLVPGSVHLLYPHREVMVGNVDFAAAVPPGTARVEYYLDDARISEQTGAPFQTKLNLGSLPRVHTIRAVAYDAHDAHIGESAVTVNDRPNALAVRIVSPVASRIESRAVIEVQTRVPEGDRLASVDLYWNDRKLATLTAPPFRYDLVLPSKNEAGYVRAVARDTQGTTVEDARLINVGGSAEEMRVDAVELHAIVQDRSGRSMEGLGVRDFVVKEDGHAVQAELHSNPADPITIGLALDTSGSMQEAMFHVVEYATEFLKGSLVEGDQTFLIAFDEAPSLVQPLTSDLQHVSSAIYDVRAGGGTAIWDSIIFSLDQLRGVHGKRALLVFTDGLDNGSKATGKALVEYGQQAGVPVYVVLIDSGAAETPSALNYQRDVLRQRREQEPLRDLAEATGGLSFDSRERMTSRASSPRSGTTRGGSICSATSRPATSRAISCERSPSMFQAAPPPFAP